MSGVEVSYATLSRRFWAFVLDVIGLSTAAGLVGAAGGGTLAWLSFFVLLAGWEVAAVATGGSPGKRALGLRITNADGSSPSVSSAIVRDLVRACSILPLGAGCWWMLDSPTSQTWHDAAAGTIVVRERRTDTGPAWRLAPPWLEGPGQEPASDTPGEPAS